MYSYLRNAVHLSKLLVQRYGSIPVVPKVCSADPKRSSTTPQGIRGYISVIITLKFTYFLIF